MNYLKGAAAVAAAVLAAVAAALTGDNSVDVTEWVNVIVMALGAAAVLVAPNVPGARYTKVVHAVLTAVAVAALSMVSDGLSATDWVQLGLAALGAVGVYSARYTPPLTRTSVPRHQEFDTQ